MRKASSALSLFILVLDLYRVLPGVTPGYEYKSAVRTKPTEYVLRKGSNCYEYVVYVYER